MRVNISLQFTDNTGQVAMSSNFNGVKDWVIADIGRAIAAPEAADHSVNFSVNGGDRATNAEVGRAIANLIDPPSPGD